MNEHVNDMAELVVIIPITVGLIRYRRTFRSYLPFLLINSTALLSGISWLVLNKRYNYNTANNFFTMIECLLWCWQFKIWKGFERNKSIYALAFGSLCTLWIVENIFHRSMYQGGSYFNIINYFFIVFLCINQLNEMVITETKSLFHQPKFLICSGIAVLLTLVIMENAFSMFHLDRGDPFVDYTCRAHQYLNLLMNTVFGIALYLVPVREPTRLSSF